MPDYVRRGGTVVPLLVGPQVGADSRAAARKELDLRLREAGLAKSDKFIAEVVVADETLQGLVRAVQPGDTLLVTASGAQILHKFRQAQIEAIKDPAECSVAIFSPRKKGRVAAVREWMIPKLTATERIRLFDQLLSGARFNPDFLIMMGMATAIAALGLLQNSGAVVIGAMLVAFLSGAAAAYAVAKPGLAGTLAGVAIAAALVPPLATAGIGLSRGMWHIASGAAILHVTNLVAITLGAAASFKLLGIQGLKFGIGPNLWARRAIIGLILAAVLLSAPLVQKSARKVSEGSTRPMAYPLSEVLYNRLTARIEQEPGLDTVLAGRSSIDKGTLKIGILIAAPGPVSPDLSLDLRKIVYDMLGLDTEVKIYTVQKAKVSAD